MVSAGCDTHGNGSVSSGLIHTHIFAIGRGCDLTSQSLKPRDGVALQPEVDILFAIRVEPWIGAAVALSAYIID